MAEKTTGEVQWEATPQLQGVRQARAVRAEARITKARRAAPVSPVQIGGRCPPFPGRGVRCAGVVSARVSLKCLFVWANHSVGGHLSGPAAGPWSAG